MFKEKFCPNCNRSHGHSNLAVASSSIVIPLRCKNCLKFFHQLGAKSIFWFCTLLFAIGLFRKGFPLVVLAALVIAIYLSALYVNRKCALVSGPKHG